MAASINDFCNLSYKFLLSISSVNKNDLIVITSLKVKNLGRYLYHILVKSIKFEFKMFCCI